MKVLKVPFHGGNMKERRGIERAPDTVEEAVSRFYMSEEGNLPVLDFDEVEVDNGNMEASHKSIEEEASRLEHFSLILGGDHSVTLPAFKGFARGKRDPGLVVFDAHPDLMEGFGTHEDYLRNLIEEGVLKPENVVLVGLRNPEKDEVKYIKEENIKNFSMLELEREGRREVSDSVMSIARQWSDLYVSIDIDVLDPAFAPGTGYREPGGLSTRDLLYFLHRIKNMKNLRMADIVEVNPELDVNDLTVSVAAKILVELS